MITYAWSSKGGVTQAISTRGARYLGSNRSKGEGACDHDELNVSFPSGVNINRSVREDSRRASSNQGNRSSSGTECQYHNRGHVFVLKRELSTYEV